MTTTSSPWAPQTGVPPVQGSADQRPLPPPPNQAVPPQPPASPPPPVERPTGRPRLWVIVLALAALMVIAVATTAAITYAITRNNAVAIPPPAVPTPAPNQPQFTASEQNAAKSRLCGAFDDATRGQQGQGGLRINGELNVPVMLRSLNSVAAVQNALTPAVPIEVADAARTYVDSTLELNSAAVRNVPIDEGNRLNAKANDAIFALADACGLPH